MADTKKFLFDTNDFNGAQATVEATYTEEQMNLAKNHSFAQGKAEGVKETHQQQEERLGDLLQKTWMLAEKLVAAEDRREVEKCIAAAKLSLQITGKLLPRFAKEYALTEIEQVILKSLEARKDEPRVAVTVPTIHLEALKSRVDALALEKGYVGRVILLADDALAPTDCRVEWADGGAERLYARLFSHIEIEITKAVSGMNASIEQKKP